MPKAPTLPKAPKEEKAKSRGRAKKHPLLEATPVERTKFFTNIGGKGGTNTLANHGSDFFRDIAYRSHKLRRERLAAALASQKPGPMP